MKCKFEIEVTNAYHADMSKHMELMNVWMNEWMNESMNETMNERIYNLTEGYGMTKTQRNVAVCLSWFEMDWTTLTDHTSNMDDMRDAQLVVGHTVDK